MPRVIIDHPEKGPQKTYLTAEVSASDTSSTVENNDDFASSDLTIFGDYGQEKTESVVLTGVTGNTQLDHGTGPVFNHSVRTPVYQILYDQAEVYSASSDDGVYSLLTTINLNFDEEDTIYDDSSGTTSTWYKIRYKNSQDSTTSDYSDEVQGTGYGDNTLASMTDEVLRSFGDPDSKEVSRDQVRKYLNAGVRRLVMNIIQTYPDYFGAYTTQPLIADTTYSYPTNFINFQRMDVGTSRTDSYPVEFISETKIDPTLNYTETNPKIAMRDSTWKTYPDCSGKTAYIVFWQYPSAMLDDSDTHGLPYGGRDVIITYALYKLWMDKNTDRAKSVYYLLSDQMEEYLEFVGQARQASNNWFQDINFGNDDYFFGRSRR